MSLKEKLAEDLKSSMKNKDTVRKNTVQLVRTAILQVEKDNKVTLDDEDILEVIAKQLKQRKDSLPEYEKSGREDLISQLKQEMECNKSPKIFITIATRKPWFGNDGNDYSC